MVYVPPACPAITVMVAPILTISGMLGISVAPVAGNDVNALIAIVPPTGSVIVEALGVLIMSG